MPVHGHWARRTSLDLDVVGRRGAAVGAAIGCRRVGAEGIGGTRERGKGHDRELNSVLTGERGPPTLMEMGSGRIEWTRQPGGGGPSPIAATPSGQGHARRCLRSVTHQPTAKMPASSDLAAGTTKGLACAR